MNTHLRILGWLYVVVGGISLASSLVFGYLIYGDGQLFGITPDVQRLLTASGLGTVMLGIFFVAATVTVIAGISLLKQALWARMLALTLGILGLFSFPFGTMLGIYTLWVLWKKEEAPPSIQI